MIYLLAITCNSVGIAGAMSDVVLQSLENLRASMVIVKTMYIFISLYNEYTYIHSFTGPQTREKDENAVS
jgi:hypothetical protein